MKRTYEDWEVTCQERIKKYELCVLHSYLDPAGIPTFGWGHNLENFLPPIQMAIITRYMGNKVFDDFKDKGIYPFSKENIEATFDTLKEPQIVADYLFEQDYCNAVNQLSGYLNEWEVGYNFEDLPDPAKIALTDMCFNMGIGRLQGFEKMFEALQEQDWDKVSAECLDSVYGRKKSSKARAKSNAELFLSCKNWVDKTERQFRLASEDEDGV